MPDPATYRVLPWLEKTAWILCDIYCTDGSPVPFSTRTLMRDALAELADAGYTYMTGLEVEFHLFALEDERLEFEGSLQPAVPPDVTPVSHGFQYLTELRQDQQEPVTDLLRRACVDLGLPLRTVEVEFGPSQCEFTFEPCSDLDTADNMVLFRSAMKQVARRNGMHVSFMCRPGLPNLFSSGWHLHQSLIDANGANAFMPAEGDTLLSETGRTFAGGLMAHAREGMVFSTPTVNGYKRYQPHSLAPDRVVWGSDNRGVMLRVIAGQDDPASRIENRVGEPAANPYLHMAAQIHAGLDGLARQLDPGPPADEPYATEAAPLPGNLIEAVAALKASTFYRSAFGDRFIDYLVHIKEAEIARFLAHVTDWEHREYFEIF